MPVQADPTAQFEIRGAIVTLGNHDFTIPPAPAATWLTVLTDEQVDGFRIIPGMLSVEEQEKLDSLLISGKVDISELTDGIYDAITVVSGHPWWWTMGLLSLTRHEQGTQVLGEMSRTNADQVSLALWVNSLYALFVKWMKEEDRAHFDTQLDTPPAGLEIDAEDLIDEQAATSAFFGMLNQSNG